jgi:cytochrome bd-type quinol oxidase subunit 2
MTSLFFVAAFLSQPVMFWPYIIPYSLRVGNVAAPETSLKFLSYGGIVVLPVIAAYTIGVFWIFRGKVGKPCEQRGASRDLTLASAPPMFESEQHPVLRKTRGQSRTT